MLTNDLPTGGSFFFSITRLLFLLCPVGDDWKRQVIHARNGATIRVQKFSLNFPRQNYFNPPESRGINAWGITSS